MRKILFAVLCLPALSWASYQPITGSTVVVQAANNNTTAIPVTQTGFPLVPTGVNSSTVAVVNGASALNVTVNTALPTGTNNLGTVTGSSVTIYSPNNNTTAIPVSQSGAWTVPGGVFIDSTSFTLGTTSQTPVGFVYIPNPTALSATSTTTAAGRMTVYRSEYVTPMDANGVILGTSTVNPLLVQTTGQVPVTGTFWQTTQPISLTGFPLVPTGVNASTVAVINGASALNITVNAALPVGTNNIGTVTGSSVTIFSPNNNTTNIPVTVSNAGFTTTGGTVTIVTENNNATAIPVSATQSGSWRVPDGVFIDSVAFTLATTSQTTAGFVYIPNPTPLLITSTTTAAGRMTPYRSEYVTPMDANGVILGTSTVNPLLVQTTGQVAVTGSFFQATQPVSLTGFPLVPTGVNASTVAVINGASALNITVNAALPTGTNNIGTVTGSSITIFAPNNNTTAIPVSATVNATVGSDNLVSIASAAILTGGVSGSQSVGGTAASTATATGNPVLIGGVYNQSHPTLTESQIINLQVTNHGGLQIASGQDALTPSENIVSVASQAVVTDGTNGVLATGGHKGDGNAVNGINRVPTLPAVYRSTYPTSTAGNDAALTVLNKSGLTAVWSGPDITLNSYSASTNTFSLASSTMDATELCGNAANTVLVTGLRVSCTQTTAGIIPITIAKRSSAYSFSWSTMTDVPEDANYAVSASSAVFFTAFPASQGTLVGYVDQAQLGCMAAATATPDDIYISPANWRMKPIVLRGTAQCLGVNFQSASMSGAKISATWEWMEATTP